MNIIWLCVIPLLLIGTIGYLLIFNIRRLIYVTIISVFFPIYFHFMGRDAFTTGTILIFILYLKFILNSLSEGNIIKEKFDWWIYLLIIVYTLSIIIPTITGFLQGNQIWRAGREYVDSFSSVLFLLVLKNYYKGWKPATHECDSEYIETLLSFFLILISIHILISFAVKLKPQYGSFFKIFLTRDLNQFDSVDREKLERISSFVFSYESYAEILATLSPIVMYKIYKRTNPMWILCLFIFTLGIILSVTRSGFILFLLGISISISYFWIDRINKTIVLVYTIIVAVAAIVYCFPWLYRDMFLRLNNTKEIYASGGTVLEILNRNIFIESWQLTISNLSLFGNGLTDFHYHNLFLTELHKRGVFGVLIFFVILLYPVKQLIVYIINNKASQKSKLAFVCLLSMLLFLINEIKFEFTRSSSYQQICMGIIAICYLASKEEVSEYDI